MHHGGLGLGILYTLWIPLLQSLRTPLSMLPLCWLNLGSLYFILTTASIPFAILGSAFGKIIIFFLIQVLAQLVWTFWCLELWLLAQPHNEFEVQNFELFLQALHPHVLFNSKKVKQICTLILFPPFSDLLSLYSSSWIKTLESCCCIKLVDSNATPYQGS